jgi:conjugative transfer region lipoprotein (TIGR03751 family)
MEEMMKILKHTLSFKNTKIALLGLVVLSLTACSTSMPKPSKYEPTMAEAYQASMLNNGHVVHGQYGSGGESAEGKQYKIAPVPSLTGAMQNKQLLKEQARDNQNFPMLPNTQVMVYIFPHYQGDLPIHGNWTTFSLYQTNHYALPSEVNTGENSNV